MDQNKLVRDSLNVTRAIELVLLCYLIWIPSHYEHPCVNQDQRVNLQDTQIYELNLFISEIFKNKIHSLLRCADIQYTSKAKLFPFNVLKKDKIHTLKFAMWKIKSNLINESNGKSNAYNKTKYDSIRISRNFEMGCKTSSKIMFLLISECFFSQSLLK